MRSGAITAAMVLALAGCAEPRSLDVFGYGPERAGRYANAPVAASWPAPATDADGLKRNLVAAVLECIRVQSVRPAPDPRQNALMAQLYDVNHASAELGPNASVSHDDYQCRVDAEDVDAPAIRSDLFSTLRVAPHAARRSTSAEAGFPMSAGSDSFEDIEFWRATSGAGREVGLAVSIGLRPEPSSINVTIRAL